MRLWAALLCLVLSTTAARSSSTHEGAYECYIAGSCELCSHDDMQDAQTACRATGHHMPIQCVVTGPTLNDVEAALAEVNRRRVKEQQFTDTPLGEQQLEEEGRHRRAVLQKASVTGKQPELVVRESNGDGVAEAGQAQRSRRRTVHTYQRCAVLAHEATGRALLGFEVLSLGTAAASLGFVWHRKRQVMLRRGMA